MSRFDPWAGWTPGDPLPQAPAAPWWRAEDRGSHVFAILFAAAMHGPALAYVLGAL